MELEEKNETSAKLNQIINNIVKKEGYITYDVKKNDSSISGGSVGNILTFDITGKTEHGDKETNIFIKQIIRPQIQMIYDIPNIYKREKYVYTDLFMEMCELQEIEGVPIADRLKTAKVFNESNDENIILENLASQGFKMYDGVDIVNLEYAELAIKALARLHGLSLAMQIKRPNYFDTKIKNKNCVYIFDQYFHEFQSNILNVATQCLPEELKDTLTPSLKKAVEKYKTYMNDDSCPVRTICHGDFRPNNVMVKEIDGKPTEVIAVDYQITFFGNPVLDFIYFIFWSTDQEFRRNHLEHLKILYYEYLGTFLRYFSIDVENVFPRKEFEKQYQEKLDFGLMISLFYLPFLFSKKDDVPNFDESAKPLNEMHFKVDDKFGDRFRGIIDDFMKWGYL